MRYREPEDFPMDECHVCGKLSEGFTIFGSSYFSEDRVSPWIYACNECVHKYPCKSGGDLTFGIFTCEHGNRWKLSAWWNDLQAKILWKRRPSLVVGKASRSFYFLSWPWQAILTGVECYKGAVLGPDSVLSCLHKLIYTERIGS